MASNTGSAATLIPLAIPLAGLIGVGPTLLVAVVAIASSVDFALVIGTPPFQLREHALDRPRIRGLTVYP